MWVLKLKNIIFKKEENPKKNESKIEEENFENSKDTVYVSVSGVYHSNVKCGNMKYYTTMIASEAVNYGYKPCPECVK